MDVTRLKVKYQLGWRLPLHGS